MNIVSTVKKTLEERQVTEQRPQIAEREKNTLSSPFIYDSSTAWYAQA